VQHQAGFGLCCQFDALHALLVREEDEAALVDLFQEHHPDVRQPGRIDGGKRHRVGIVRLGGLGVGKPGCKQTEWLRDYAEVTGN
jgi:hypothetical protein